MTLRLNFNHILLSIVLTLASPIALGNLSCATLFTQAEIESDTALKAIKDSAKQIRKKDIGATTKEILTALNGDPRFQWIVSKIIENQVGFAMNRNEERRLSIMQSGFLNQYEAKKSGGSYDPRLRIEVEAAYSNLPVGIYEQIPISLRPKYGYLIPPVGDKLKRTSSSEDYGSDTYVFKMETLKDRTTWVPGDSLDQYKYYAGDNDIVKIPRASRFLPWGSRALMLPYLSSNKKPTELSITESSDKIQVGNLNMKLTTPTNQNYIELQFWGRVSFDDVETFIFSGNEPKGLFLMELQRRGIRIFRNNGENDILWWSSDAGHPGT